MSHDNDPWNWLESCDPDRLAFLYGMVKGPVHLIREKEYLCQFAEMFDFTAWHQMASSTFHIMAFDCPNSLQSNDITWNVLEAIRCQAAVQV